MAEESAIFVTQQLWRVAINGIDVVIETFEIVIYTV
jgi:hypothetical protein